MLNDSLWRQLRDQLPVFQKTFPNSSPEAWERKPDSGRWSARENLAHLARYHQVLYERLRRIEQEDRPQFARYRAENDPEWTNWQSLPLPILEDRIRSQRQELVIYVSRLSDAQLSRTGIHPALGEFNVTQWLEFFLLHEGHHLYTILFMLGK